MSFTSNVVVNPSAPGNEPFVLAGAPVDETSAQTLTNKALDGVTSLALKSASAFDLLLVPTESLTADRTLNLDLNDATRTIDLGGNLTLASSFSTVGAFGLTLTQTGVTNITLPTTGTLATTAGSSDITTTTSLTTQQFICNEPGGGSATAPAGARDIDPDTGYYWGGANEFNIATGGVRRVGIEDTKVDFNVPIECEVGSVSAAGIYFKNNVNVGFWYDNAGTIGVTISGTNRLSINNTGISVGAGQVAAGSILLSGSITNTGASSLNIQTANNQNLVLSANGTGNILMSAASIGITGPTTVTGDATVTGTTQSAGLRLGIATLTANTTLTATHYTVLGDATTATFTVTLPAAASHSGRIYNIQKINSGGNDVIVDGNGAETIGGAASYTLNAQYESITVQSNGTNWFII